VDTPDRVHDEESWTHRIKQAQAALILQNYLTGWKRIADHIKQEDIKDKEDAERKA